jgi:hypothetical protein
MLLRSRTYWIEQCLLCHNMKISEARPRLELIIPYPPRSTRSLTFPFRVSSPPQLEPSKILTNLHAISGNLDLEYLITLTRYARHSRHSRPRLCHAISSRAFGDHDLRRSSIPRMNQQPTHGHSSYLRLRPYSFSSLTMLNHIVFVEFPCRQRNYIWESYGPVCLKQLRLPLRHPVTNPPYTGDVARHVTFCTNSVSHRNNSNRFAACTSLTKRASVDATAHVRAFSALLR